MDIDNTERETKISDAEAEVYIRVFFKLNSMLIL